MPNRRRLFFISASEFFLVLLMFALTIVAKSGKNSKMPTPVNGSSGAQADQSVAVVRVTPQGLSVNGKPAAPEALRQLRGRIQLIVNQRVSLVRVSELMRELGPDASASLSITSGEQQ